MRTFKHKKTWFLANATYLDWEIVYNIPYEFSKKFGWFNIPPEIVENSFDREDRTDDFLTHLLSHFFDLYSVSMEDKSYVYNWIQKYIYELENSHFITEEQRGIIAKEMIDRMELK